MPSVGHKTTVWAVFAGLWRNPAKHLVYRWNWKSAIVSPGFRAAVFFFSNLPSGWRAATGAALFELLYRAPAAGVYGALTQSFRSAEPAWAANIAVMILLPLISHTIEFLLHLARGTPHLRVSIISSVCFTMLATVFNIFAMRRGVLITGGEDGGSVASDMRRMPRIVLDFVLAGPLAVYRLIRALIPVPVPARIETEN